MKVAIVHDWLTVYAGAERVLEELLGLYPEADLFSLIDYLPKPQRGFLGNRIPHTSFMQHLPLVSRFYRRYLPLMPTAIERFDLSDYDLVLSSSYAVAKGVLTHSEQLHICYLQARNLKYAYEDRHHYPGSALRRLVEDLALTRLRTWDHGASQRPDLTVANSQFVSRWHLHRHGVPSRVIYPPVNTRLFADWARNTKEDFYITVGRLEPYKRMDLLVEAFHGLPSRLLVIGRGTQMAALQRIAPNNVSFLGYREPAAVGELLGQARAFVFAGCEDFGIAALEAQAAGTPVIAFCGGGACETIRGLEEDRPTGVLFARQTAPDIVHAIETFERCATMIRPAACQANARRFETERFRAEFSSFVAESLAEWKKHGPAIRRHAGCLASSPQTSGDDEALGPVEAVP
jgi:glycosyltransferase involved in cell wall biosynthesis